MRQAQPLPKVPTRTEQLRAVAKTATQQRYDQDHFTDEAAEIASKLGFSGADSDVVGYKLRMPGGDRVELDPEDVPPDAWEPGVDDHGTPKPLPTPFGGFAVGDAKRYLRAKRHQIHQAACSGRECPDAGAICEHLGLSEASDVSLVTNWVKASFKADSQ